MFWLLSICLVLLDLKDSNPKNKMEKKINVFKIKFIVAMCVLTNEWFELMVGT